MNPNGLAGEPLSPAERKTQEYVSRALAGEPAKDLLRDLPPGMRERAEDAIVRALVEKMEAEAAADTPVSPEPPGSLDGLPTRYQGLPADLVEDMWVLPIYVDPQRNTELTQRRRAVLEELRRREESVGSALDKFDQSLGRANEIRAELGGQPQEPDYGALYGRLSPEARAEFPKAQAAAARIFLGWIEGRESGSFDLSAAERGVLDVLVARRRESGGSFTVSEALTEEEMATYAKLSWRLAFGLLAGRYRGEAPDVDAAAPQAKVSPATGPTLAPPEKQSLLASPEGWRGVERPSRVEAVGDLNGSYRGFRENVAALGVAAETAPGHVAWTGGDSRLVFVGDITGDRNPEGLSVMASIRRLSREAAAAGGSVEAIAGNHDNMFVGFLGGFGADRGDMKGLIEACVGGGYNGFSELLRYADEPLRARVREGFAKVADAERQELERRIKTRTAYRDSVEGAARRAAEISLASLQNQLRRVGELQAALADPAACPLQPPEAYMYEFLSGGDQTATLTSLAEQRQQILEGMRRDPEGREALEAICDMKLAVSQDDTLFVHTTLTQGMAEELLRGGSLGEALAEVNGSYRKGLRAVLLGERVEPEAWSRYHALRQTFLYTSNRKNFSDNPKVSAEERERLAGALHGRGVNLVVHGHQPPMDGEGVAGVLPIVSIDGGNFKDPHSSYDDRSVLDVPEDGTVTYGAGKGRVALRA